ncbi:Adenosine kinase [Fusarium oxysporum f. sp. albedinis]|nr:Adenosine kinase [Fusarium oxysporum f. sp. albedinis]
MFSFDCRTTLASIATVEGSRLALLYWRLYARIKPELLAIEALGHKKSNDGDKVFTLRNPIEHPMPAFGDTIRHDEKNAGIKCLKHTHTIAVVCIRCLLSKSWFPNHVDDVAYALRVTEASHLPESSPRPYDSVSRFVMKFSSSILPPKPEPPCFFMPRGATGQTTVVELLAILPGDHATQWQSKPSRQTHRKWYVDSITSDQLVTLSSGGFAFLYIPSQQLHYQIPQIIQLPLNPLERLAHARPIGLRCALRLATDASEGRIYTVWRSLFHTVGCNKFEYLLKY